MQQSLFNHFTSHKKATRSQTAKDLASKQQQSFNPINTIKQTQRKRSRELTPVATTKRAQKINVKISQQSKNNEKIAQSSKTNVQFVEEEPIQNLNSGRKNNNQQKNNSIQIETPKRITRNSRSRSKTPKKTEKKPAAKKGKKRPLPKDLLQEIQQAGEPVPVPEKSEIQKKAEKILAKPSLKDRYEELTYEESSNLVLPPDYKELLQFFTQVDATLEFFVEKGKIGYFDELAVNIDRIYRKSFSTKDIQRILHLAPELFELKYYFNDQKRKQQLCLKYHKNEKINLPKRKQAFRQKLIMFTHKQHYNFLQQNNNIEYLLKVQKIWHPNFDINRVDEVPLAPLPKKPTDIHVESLSTHFSINQKNQSIIKSNAVRNIMKNLAEKQEIEKNKKQQLLEEAKKIKLEQGQNKMGISDSLFKMIQAKKKLREEEQQKRMTGLESTHNENVVYMKKLVGIVSMYYKIRNVSSMAIVQVIEHVKMSDQFKLMHNNQVHNLLKELSQHSQGYVTIKQNRVVGECLLLNKAKDPSQVQQLLDKIE